MADLFSRILETSLNPDSFRLLLNWLNPDVEKADKTYLEVRKKIIRYFQIQGCLEAEDCADMVFLRIGQKLASNTKIETQEPYAYARGIARLVLMEYWRGKQEKFESLDELLPNKHPSIDPKNSENEQDKELRQEAMLKCLASCLQQLPSESYEMFIQYHQETQRTKIDKRLILSQKLGIDITTLRNRVTRIRAKLERCINNCLNQE